MVLGPLGTYCSDLRFMGLFGTATLVRPVSYVSPQTNGPWDAEIPKYLKSISAKYIAWSGASLEQVALDFKGLSMQRLM